MSTGDKIRQTLIYVAAIIKLWTGTLNKPAPLDPTQPPRPLDTPDEWGGA